MAPAEHIWLCQASQDKSEEEEPFADAMGMPEMSQWPNVCGELASNQACCQGRREQPGRRLLGWISARLLGTHFARLGAKRPQELDQGKVCSRGCCHMCFRSLKRPWKPSARSVWCRQVLACQAYGLSVPMASFVPCRETTREWMLTKPEVSMLAAEYGSWDLRPYFMAPP